MKFGVLGLGSIGLRHARNLRMLGHDVIGYDTDEKKQKEFQGRFHAHEDVLDKTEAIIIATPTVNHYHDIQACIGAAKSFFIEKPIASTREEYELLSQQPNVNYAMCGYMLRFHPCVKAAKAWIDNGNIGKPLWASFICGQFNDKPDYLRDGVAANWSHEIDLALYLLGPAKVDVASVRLTENKDDAVDFVLLHDSGARSTIHLDYITKNEIREGWIVGTEKNIGLDMLGRQVAFGKMVQKFDGDWNSDYIDEMAAFIEGCQGKETHGATGADGLAALEVILAVKEKGSANGRS